MDNIKILNFAKGQELPKFYENRSKEWINYGENNLYPEYLLDVYNNKSNKHKAIINRKVDMTTGNGIQKPVSQELQNFINNKWGKKDLEEISVKLNYDLEIMGGFALWVKWNLTGEKVVAIDYLPFNKCRLSPDEEDILVSKDWKYPRKNENKPETYCRFNPKKSRDFPTQIYYYVEETPGVEYYTIPYYSSTINWIELDWEISNFHLSSVRQGFMPSFVLNFATGVPTQEEMDEVYRSFEKQYTGSENAGKFILTFSSGQDEKPELTPINLNNSDERFVNLAEQIQTEIFVGHSVTNPLLFGIKTPGSLGGKDELLESLAVFESTYIKNKRTIIERCLNKITKYNNIQEPIIFNQYEIDFGNIENKEQTNA